MLLFVLKIEVVGRGSVCKREGVRVCVRGSVCQRERNTIYIMLPATHKVEGYFKFMPNDNSCKRQKEARKIIQNIYTYIYNILYICIYIIFLININSGLDIVMFGCLSLYFSVYLPVCLSVRLFACPFV